jgi:hypothetical protein
VCAVYVAGIAFGWYGRHQGAGSVTAVAIEPARSQDAQQSAARGVGSRSTKQILFGDLHVHTTFSSDAFRMSLPMVQGTGAHPPADACDFARFCSALDFWSINDHAESLTPQHWEETKESIRQCNAVTDPANPDVVAFTGWEWTKAGGGREAHYGHKNVIFRDTGEDQVPVRPISSAAAMPDLVKIAPSLRVIPPLFDLPNRQSYYDFDALAREMIAVPTCPTGVDVRELPPDCAEVAPTPKDLFSKLSEWGFDSIVIPHGNSWGLGASAGLSWDNQLVGALHDPEKQTLIEVFSGHGNSEEYRPWRAVVIDDQGKARCPEPSPGFLPSCWRAGELISARCKAAGEDPAECERRAVEARQLHVDHGKTGWYTVPGATIDDWLDAGQCTDCFLPPFNHRPGGSAQYSLAITNFDDPQAPKRFRFGFIASSDTHMARAGFGYKQVDRYPMVDWWGYADPGSYARFGPDTGAVKARAEPFTGKPADSLALINLERAASFFVTGGLVAAHTSGRRREAIWDALKAKEVYGTSGERILLWFDLLNSPDNGLAPMGSEVEMSEAPRFEVRAAGALIQKPSCPDYSTNALSKERLHSLCRGECYNPSDQRRLITRIEIVRIRPQARPGEPLDGLVEDPWRVFPCSPQESGCSATFEDPEFESGSRDVAYYARAIQEATPTINGANLRCEYDEDGACIRVNPCYGGFRTAEDDDCLAEVEGRAWSSPIFVDYRDDRANGAGARGVPSN